MKHDDKTLQAAIDAAMLEIKTGTQHKSLDTYVSNYWHKESPARLALAKSFLAHLPEAQPILATARGEAVGINGLTEAEEAKTASVAGLSKLGNTGWKTRAEKAEVELATLKSSQLSILRPLAEAGPVPDGCVRVIGNNKSNSEWTLATWEDEYDTHFADIRLPVTETPAQTVNEQPRQQVPLGPEQKLQAIKNILESK